MPVQLPSGRVADAALILESFEATECSILLGQPEERARQGPFYVDLFEPLACLGFVLIRIGKAGRLEEAGAAVFGDTEVVAATRMRCNEVVSADCWLKAEQTYLLLPLCLHRGAVLPATFAVVSSRPLVFEERTLDAVAVRSAWACYARTSSEKERRVFHGAILYTRKAAGGSLVIMVENRGSGFLQVELNIESTGLRYSRGLPATNDWLPPGFGQILQIALPNESSGGNSEWKYQHNFKISACSPAPPWHTPDPCGETAVLHEPFRL